MEAKDTILKSSLNADGSVHYPTMEEQTEISFKAGERKVVEVLKQLHLFVGRCPPIEGEAYVYLGDYILRYGKNLEPQAGFYRLSDSPEWQKFFQSEEIE